ncbi:hypothetical protein [Scytonema millei]|uniref:Uncharacterized protein n=1 Tax=Scytonema millei VB511283 TaxID=1245923 RepID=A0A9X5I6M6_9CYAN|nr:hypothetical protein [Scytonema millei]NHC36899.1 hypothetical protein [Scytonema millei VB511283]
MFATTRFYPVNEKDGTIYLDTQAIKRDCLKFPGCTGMTGFELNQKFPMMQQLGYKLVRLTPKRRGGARAGAGRPKGESQKTSTIQIDRRLHEELKARTARLKQILGSYSLQDYVASAIFECDPDLQELASFVQPMEADATTITTVIHAIERLKIWQVELSSICQEGVALGAVLAALLKYQKSIEKNIVNQT